MVATVLAHSFHHVCRFHMVEDFERLFARLRDGLSVAHCCTTMFLPSVKHSFCEPNISNRQSCQSWNCVWKKRVRDIAWASGCIRGLLIAPQVGTIRGSHVDFPIETKQMPPHFRPSGSQSPAAIPWVFGRCLPANTKISSDGRIEGTQGLAGLSRSISNYAKSIQFIWAQTITNHH